MKAEPRAARPGVLVILAAALWWHALIPGLILLAFILWAVLHRRYQGVRRERFMRVRQRVWPPPPLVLAAVIVAGTMLYGMTSAPIEMKVLPITLNVLAAGMLVTAAWTRVARWRAVEAPGPA